MSHATRRTQSPQMWRAGGIGEASSATKTRISYDSPGSSPWRDGRDDSESGREHEIEGSSEEIPDEKVKKFDDLIKRIEAEGKRMTSGTTVGISTPLRSKPRLEKNGNPSSAPSSSYDFASRARELRMSLDFPTPTRPPKRTDSEGKCVHFAQLARDMTPRRVLRTPPSPIKSRIFDGMSEGSLTRNDFPSRRSPSPAKSYPPLPSPSPALDSREDEFRVQVENFHSNLVSAHETITTLENEVRNLKEKVEEKDECISSLEQKNKSKDKCISSLEQKNDSSSETVRNIEKEARSLVAEQNAASKKHAEELQKLRTECDEYKNHTEEVDKLSAERYAAAKEIEKEKEKLQGSIQDKDKMIGSLRNEIQRLNEELADGAFVRSQALKAKEAATKLEAALEKSKKDHESATKLVVDLLETKLKEKASEFDKALIEKDKAIATLKSKILEGQSMKQSSEMMKEKICCLESQLDESKIRNNQLSGKMKDLEKRLELAESEASTKEKDIKQLETRSKSCEMELKRQLETERRESSRQRARLEKYVNDSSAEQETVAALERAIEDLETAHNESNSEITMLQKENQRLAATLTEAEHYMKMFRNEMKDYATLKPKILELQEINSDLSQQLQNKEDLMKDSTERIASLEMKIETNSVSSKQKILQLEKLAARKQDDILRLQATKCDSEEQEEDANKKLIEITSLFEENEAELEKLRINKGKMLRTIAKLQRELDQLRNESKSRVLNTKLEHDQVQESQKESKRAWVRVGVLEENLKELQHKLSVAERRADDSPRIEELTRELASVKEKLAERDEQLADSRVGIAEAQKMIFRLMNVVQEMRK
eukprot:CAMPEP_0172539068 /NCGR_PEP_ID=MMETSP1067-20121228/10341_1 /TAXON_ID=265564 ORGANISM="Thalassiosira punctigera, Strain Tpunct2005C2" /NCGR_SAMPLE_ID=MMETSP1067 /ASSEMBLY_ACC=CAM_ASM_000444 /LENGTH=832 /DNA_ID=CAMNT_0013324693 /DNA_START=56 /DNA_END=2551 /DNA_ORIENTATION=+